MDMDNSTLLAIVNQEENYHLIPVAVFLGLTGITGLIGNSIVCYIYGTVYTQSNSRTFLLPLAVIYLCTCVVCIPLEILTLLNQYEFEEPLVCKFSRSGNTLTTFYAISLLISIAIDRHRKICHPHGFQMSHKFVKWLCFVLFFGMILITWPAFVMYGVKSTPFEYQGQTLIQRECSIDDEFNESIYSKIYTFMIVILFIVALTILIVLYTLIGRKVRYFAYKNERRESQSNTLDSDDDTIDEDSRRSRIVRLKNLIKVGNDQQVRDNQYVKIAKKNFQKSVNVDHNIQNIKEEASIGTISMSLDSEHTGNSTLEKVKEQRKVVHNQPSSTQLDQIRRKRKLARNTTYLMFIVTGSFIGVCLPHLIFTVIHHLIFNFNALDSSGRTAYRFFLRSYFLGAAINPIIYSIFDQMFVRACKGVLRDIRSTLCKRSQLDVQ